MLHVADHIFNYFMVLVLKEPTIRFTVYTATVVSKKRVITHYFMLRLCMWYHFFSNSSNYSNYDKHIVLKHLHT